jgi:hypothetical protein
MKRDMRWMKVMMMVKLCNEVNNTYHFYLELYGVDAEELLEGDDNDDQQGDWN